MCCTQFQFIHFASPILFTNNFLSTTAIAKKRASCERTCENANSQMWTVCRQSSIPFRTHAVCAGEWNWRCTAIAAIRSVFTRIRTHRILVIRFFPYVFSFDLFVGWLVGLLSFVWNLLSWALKQTSNFHFLCHSISSSLSISIHLNPYESLSRCHSILFRSILFLVIHILSAFLWIATWAWAVYWTQQTEFIIPSRAPRCLERANVKEIWM